MTYSFLLVPLISFYLLITTINTKHCETGDFKCSDRGGRWPLPSIDNCTFQSLVCDGYPDCPFGDDEHNCPGCKETGWICPSTGDCIPSTWSCPNDATIWDCPMQDDVNELNCGACEKTNTTNWRCSDNGRCIPKIWLCDCEIDCLNGEDEDRSLCGLLCEPTPVFPTSEPTHAPTSEPTFVPSIKPTNTPTNIPTFVPTLNPTLFPTLLPTMHPSTTPTFYPTQIPSKSPSKTPTFPPTKNENAHPSSIVRILKIDSVLFHDEIQHWIHFKTSLIQIFSQLMHLMSSMMDIDIECDHDHHDWHFSSSSAKSSSSKSSSTIWSSSSSSSFWSSSSSSSSEHKTRKCPKSEFEHNSKSCEIQITLEFYEMSDYLHIKSFLLERYHYHSGHHHHSRHHHKSESIAKFEMLAENRIGVYFDIECVMFRVLQIHAGIF